MRIKVKWHFKETTDCIGQNFVVKEISVKNGKGIGEIEIPNDLSEDILGEVLSANFSIMSIENDTENNDSYQSDNETQLQEDVQEDEGFMVLTKDIKNQKIRNTTRQQNNPASFVEPIETVEPVAPIKTTKDTAKKDYIRTVDELYEHFEFAARTKNSNISTDNILNSRDKMLAEEQKAREEAIDIPAWIVNKKYASLTVDDIGIGLNRNSPVDLSRYSAAKLRVSRDLKTLLSKKYIEIISLKEAAEIFNNNNSTNIDFSELGQTKSKKQALHEIQSGKFNQRFSDEGNYLPEENIYDQYDDSSIDLTSEIQGTYNRSNGQNGPNRINGKPIQKQQTIVNNLGSNGKPKFKPIRPMSEM